MNLSPLLALIQGTRLEALAPLISEDYLAQITHGDFPKWRRLLGELPAIAAGQVEFGEYVSIGSSADIDPQLKAQLELQLKQFIPWRKGPFKVFDIEIDTEWRSNVKWDRLASNISSLTGKRVLDVGSGNGYYGYRMLEAEPALVIGIDPHIAYMAQFWALKHFTPQLPLFVLPLTLEQMPQRLQQFDTTFSMGVIYHRRSPIDHLLQLKDTLVVGGELILETLYVDGDEGYCLTPQKRYARMSNVWFVPSIPTLLQWLTRCGFVNAEVIDISTTSLEEQRKTEWMPYDSLVDALDAEDPAITIEGLPAPKRVVIKAYKK